MVFFIKWDDVLGFIYVCAWSVSMYPPVIKNWMEGSSTAISMDFVILNTTGYFYLLVSFILQLSFWVPISAAIMKGDGSVEKLIVRPKVTNFDYWYCLHGFIMNWVLVSQVIYGSALWKFKVELHTRRMKSIYLKYWLLSIIIFTGLSIKFFRENAIVGWQNSRTLNYCNNLFLLKISMSLVKYIPQVLHNYERKSMNGFAIQSVFLDVIGGVASLLQLVCQLREDKGFNYITFVANFGKIGLALVTLIFNFTFISQWKLYGE
ncbi:hypothetical protein HG535_0A07500 [Zygotorulaspora mrakii]|uniref:Uncharacterized protein n=1 Tax=Zygotorulaspora mrakii TaxID=42260 RepID=A0A7H9AWL9_ZYGMR|nr:uncharacterized protein HG535_0A07500 [Zygotorulaspora mrakii]QLG70808.1 hypothetical protein HG535_0A07500 [Zygotorulaspora mrakii]